jgi:hypothetical protein
VKTLKLIPALLAAACLLPVVPAFSAEETGDVIEKLVAEVDQQLATFEALAEKQSEGKEPLRSQLDEQFALYDKATNVTERAAVRGEILGLLARLNKADRADITATMDMVVSIVETMKKLESTVKNSVPLNPDKAKDQKAQMVRFVQNSARILKALERIDESKPGGYRAGALKNSLVMLNRQMADPMTGAGSALGRINETMRALEDVAVQLRILQGMLGSEHAMLVASTHVQTVDLALLRLARARLGADSVADIPVNRNKDLIERVRKSRRPISESDATLTGLSASSVEKEFLLLADGELE